MALHHNLWCFSLDFPVLVSTGLRLSSAADPVFDANRGPLRGRSVVENWASVESRINK
jgi:hypothetical protein